MKPSDTTVQTVLVPAESKQMVDTLVMPLLSRLTQDARTISPHYETLWQEIQQLYSAGGKRLRSYMTLLTYQAYSHESPQTILPAAAAQELLHTAMLIHDDVIDRDDIRYGVKNIARKYIDHYEELIPDATDRRHYASSAALLAGDLLISQAYILMTETNVEPALVVSAQQLLSKAIFRVVGGELLDTEAAFRGSDAADPLLIAKQKTASYSFANPFLMGATLAKASPIQRNILEKLGEELGIAYQLRDDILGVFGDKAKTGKSVDGDIKEGKRTVLIQQFYRLATADQKNEFKKIFGRHDVTDAQIAHVKDQLIESGAKASVEKQIAAYRSRAHVIRKTLDIAPRYDTAFGNLIDLCSERDT